MAKEEVSFPHSSSVDRAEWDADNGLLTVWFTTGASYNYHGINAAMWNGLKSSESAGGYLHRHIRGRFRTERL